MQWQATKQATKRNNKKTKTKRATTHPFFMSLPEKFEIGNGNGSKRRPLSILSVNHNG
jgi:hypothetical protein